MQLRSPRAPPARARARRAHLERLAEVPRSRASRRTAIATTTPRKLRGRARRCASWRRRCRRRRRWWGSRRRRRKRATADAGERRGGAAERPRARLKAESRSCPRPQRIRRWRRGSRDRSTRARDVQLERCCSPPQNTSGCSPRRRAVEGSRTKMMRASRRGGRDGRGAGRVEEAAEAPPPPAEEEEPNPLQKMMGAAVEWMSIAGVPPPPPAESSRRADRRRPRRRNWRRRRRRREQQRRLGGGVVALAGGAGQDGEGGGDVGRVDRRVITPRTGVIGCEAPGVDNELARLLRWSDQRRQLVDICCDLRDQLVLEGQRVEGAARRALAPVYVVALIPRVCRAAARAASLSSSLARADPALLAPPTARTSGRMWRRPSCGSGLLPRASSSCRWPTMCSRSRRQAIGMGTNWPPLQHRPIPAVPAMPVAPQAAAGPPRAGAPSRQARAEHHHPAHR